MSTSYMDLINCSTPEEVYVKVREWSSDLTEEEHIVRSTIFDIDADIERILKQVLYQSLVGLIFNGDGQEEYEKHCQKLEKMVNNLPFGHVYPVLRPALDAAPHDEFDDINKIHQVRNSLAHPKNLSKVTYKGRNPFLDHDALAQLFFDGWAIRQQLSEFYDKMIAAPKTMLEHYEKFYWENRDRVEGAGGA
jgi:hypothetical protein